MPHFLKYFSGGCGANFVLNKQLGGGASDIVNASSDYETGSHGMDGVTANHRYEKIKLSYTINNMTK